MWQAAIHGDLNADNVLVDERGNIALLDWDECRADATCFDLMAWLEGVNRSGVRDPWSSQGGAGRAGDPVAMVEGERQLVRHGFRGTLDPWPT